MLTTWLNSITQFLTTASLWVQVPLVLLVAVPLAAVFASLLLRLVDASSFAWTGFWARLGVGVAGDSPAAADSDSTRPGT